MDIWVVSTFWLLWIMVLWVFINKFSYRHAYACIYPRVYGSIKGVYVYTYMYTIILVIYLWVDLLGFMVIPRLTLWGTAKLFFKAAVLFYIPTSNAWGWVPISLCSLQHLLLLVSLLIARVSVNCHPVVLHFSSELLCWTSFPVLIGPFVYLFCISFYENTDSNLLLIFKWSC